MSQLATLKMQTQERVLGVPCSMLACARLNRINYCMADCEAFPCENYANGAYPFSRGFLDMQLRRRDELRQSESYEDGVRVAAEHWQSLRTREPAELKRATGVTIDDEGNPTLTVLNQTVRVLPEKERVEVYDEGRWQPATKFLSLIAVVYLATVQQTGLSGRWVTENDLSCASFFRGIHALPLSRLLDCFGAAAEDFVAVCQQLGGTSTGDDGDAAMRLWVLPQVPVKLILWCRDDELPAAITIMFDDSIEALLPADGIWAMVHLLRDAMLALAFSR